MINITKVSYTRKYNLGNYESLDLSAEAQLFDKDNLLEAWSILADNTEMWFIDYQRKKTQPPMKPEPQPAPEKQAKPTALFKEETIKNTLTDLNGDIKPIHYITDAALYGRINEDLKSHGYRWISAGKESRWSKT